MENCYPKWLYHKTLPAIIVQSKEEHDALKGDWKEVPFAVDQEQASPSKKQEAGSDVSEEQKEGHGHEDELVVIKKRKPKGDQ